MGPRGTPAATGDRMMRGCGGVRGHRVGHGGRRRGGRRGRRAGRRWCGGRSVRGRGRFDGRRRLWPGVSGNGISVVWKFTPEEKQVVERAAEGAVEGGLVAAQKLAFRVGRELDEGGGDAGESVAWGLDGDALVQELGFDGADAAGAPVGGDEILEAGGFQRVGGA